MLAREALKKRHTLHDPCLSLRYDEIDIKMTAGHKILGVQVDENLMWNNHFQLVSKKVSSHLWLLSKIQSYLSVEHRLLFYNAYVKPHFEYCSVVWSNTSNYNINRISKLKRCACKLILSHVYNGLQESLKRLDILSSDQSVFRTKIMYNNLAPWYNENCTNCEKYVKILFSQFIHFSSVLLTKNVLSFYIFHRGSRDLRRKMYKIFSLYIFRFRLRRKNV